MTPEPAPKTPEPAPQSGQIVLAIFLFAGALSSGGSVWHAISIYRNWNPGWLTDHPWFVAGQCIGPVMLLCVASTWISTGRRRKILASLTLLVALAGFLCASLGQREL